MALNEVAVQAVQDVFALAAPPNGDVETPMVLAQEIASTPSRAAEALFVAGRLVKVLAKAWADAESCEDEGMFQEYIVQVMARIL